MKKIYPFLLLFFAIMLMMKHDDAFSQDYSSLSNLPQQSEKSSGVYPPRESSAFPCDSKEPVRAGSIRVNREDYVNGKLVTTLTPEEFVIDVLLGQGGDKCAVNGMISNVVFTGYGWDQATETWTAAAENRSLSYFCGGTENEIEIINGDTVVMSLDMRSGILLTTGPGRCAEGPNTSGSACGSQSPYVMLNGDADMLTLGPVTDGARLEFDFVPLQHKISFEYIFASEEYSEFVYGVNDVFGFFMAEVDDYGNIIPGTTQNIALLPNSIIPITINTVNWDASCNSTPACFPGCPDNCSIDAANPQYFVPNYDTAPYQGQYMQFDGRTVVLTAEANVTPGKTYHLKLAVANVMDNAYGSGVFLRAGSLDIGSGFINLGPGGLEMNNVFEGCEGNALEIKFPPSDTEITYIDFEYSGTAVGDIVQLDNSPMPTSLEIPLLETSVTIPYKVKSPVTLNGGEVQIIATTQRGNCDQIDSVLLTVYSKITDPQIATTIACTAGGGSITVTITGGSPNAQMSIDGGNSWQLVSDPFTGVEPDEYLLMITDYISCDTLFLPVTLYGQPVLSNTTTIIPDMCSGKMAQYTATCVIEGVIFSWERDEIPGISPPTGSGTGPTIKETLTNSTSEPITVTYVYTLIIDDCHNTQEVTVVVYPELVQPDPDDATIPYNTTHTFDLAPAIGGSGAITYLWQESIDGSTWTTAPPPNDNEYYTTPVLTCSRYYRRQATSEFCNKITSAAALVTVTFPITLIPEPPNGGDVVGEGDYACGSPVIVIAIPDTCYNFVNWTEDDVVVSTNSSYLFIATAPRILTAHFIPKQYAILTEEDPDEGGETYGGGNHDCGTEVTVTAVPAYGYDFVNWTEDDDEVANTPDYTFIAAEHRLLTAHFEPKMYDIELLVNPPLPLVAGDVFGAGSYPYGENITVSAVAETCYFFVNWTEDNVEVSKNADYTFTVTKDRILVANFDRLSYDVIVLPNPTGGGTVDGGGSHLCGDTIPIWAVPNDCYDFVDWTENGVSLSTDPYYDFIVTGHHVL
ncbi:MAG: choice-of-anchor L domain-containing protein, partial [Bacteroidales bacterium]|nr:choice-of-anchor L domain-containing protein [Bacteroidales bacterium]